MTVEELTTALRLYPDDCQVLVSKGYLRVPEEADPVTEIVVDEVRRTVELVAD